MENAADPGEVWWWDPTDFAGAANDLLVGATGVSPRYIRCLYAVCVITNYGSDSITVLYWPDHASPPVIKGTQAVGTGPVGVQLIPDGGGAGGILALTTGTGSDDFTVTPIAADGTIGPATTTPFTDCLGPGHAVFAGAGATQVVATCHDNDRIEVFTR
jgi:hypothetical protein